MSKVNNMEERLAIELLAMIKASQHRSHCPTESPNVVCWCGMTLATAHAVELLAIREASFEIHDIGGEA
jgi:hypothetical protein